MNIYQMVYPDSKEEGIGYAEHRLLNGILYFIITRVSRYPTPPASQTRPGFHELVKLGFPRKSYCWCLSSFYIAAFPDQNLAVGILPDTIPYHVGPRYAFQTSKPETDIRRQWPDPPKGVKSPTLAPSPTRISPVPGHTPNAKVQALCHRL